jgi:hypothetical protein
MTGIVVALLPEHANPVARSVSKQRRVHLQLADTEDRYFAPCAPHLVVTGRPGRGLAFHPKPVTCSRCKTLMLRAQRAVVQDPARRTT